MKKNKILYIIILVAFFIFCSKSDAQIIKAELKATGLTCSMCSKATLKQLRTLEGVDSVGTDLNTTTFIIFFKKDNNINPNDIKQKVEDAGFSVGELILILKVDNQKVENNSSFVQNNISYIFMESKTSNLYGEIKLKVLNKGFIVDKEYKKLLKLSKQYPSYAASIKNTYHIKTL